ncbi:hypothetical protein CER18_08785 [Bartonella tribocorum]|uniref:Uncharacterized protein n=1 Tax=Bartonella tribocorum TaxID=85701 RepID=A0A2N9Y8D3_9HYPH|nr:hypothetical protein CER18_08785 [Bartonella tribocorum]
MDIRNRKILSFSNLFHIASTKTLSLPYKKRQNDTHFFLSIFFSTLMLLKIKIIFMELLTAKIGILALNGM